ncbi:MAG: L,D-transpeptidase family protein [Rhodoferax sp.]|jgi:L,D-transpeptidase YnhG|nr:L,D-transpeptidase family protein [Rhodoferax sp.]MBP9059323.1 L,D-transpeptidase family protein [Rhodoferax sp.]MBP9683492.1 L,D-transpeptidase family protein [Rhodoferax sp.]
MKRYFSVLGFSVFVALTSTAQATIPKKAVSTSSPASAVTPKKVDRTVDAGLAEARLIEVYILIARAKNQEALAKATRLVQDFPHFQLAQLVYGDLLSARMRPIQRMGDVPDHLLKDSSVLLNHLRDESQIRLKALRERPPPGTIPSQFLALSPRNKHAIAVDASRSRLYLFENRPQGLTLVADYYISVGKAGIEKYAEGDARTPLGVYFITSNLDPKSLKTFYGSGALPLNYPNVLDTMRGKTGSGIWLHGTPPGQFSRAPLATDGCVVLSNPDLEQIVRTVEIRTTPVVISQRLQWLTPDNARSHGKPFEDVLSAWQRAKSSGSLDKLLSFYAQDFNSNGKTLREWTPALRSEMEKARGRAIELKDLSLLRWTDTAETMVVTFGEVTDGTRFGTTKRQYWLRQGKQWKIFYEGVVG